MAPKLTLEQLREQAKKLMEQAAEEEARRHQLIGFEIIAGFAEISNPMSEDKSC
jgi:hypothetical protein